MFLCLPSTHMARMLGVIDRCESTYVSMGLKVELESSGSCGQHFCRLSHFLALFWPLTQGLAVSQADWNSLCCLGWSEAHSPPPSSLPPPPLLPLNCCNNYRYVVLSLVSSILMLITRKFYYHLFYSIPYHFYR